MNKSIVIFLLSATLLAGCRPGKEAGRGAVPAEERLKREAAVAEAKMLAETGQTEAAESAWRALLAQDGAYGAALYELSGMMIASGRTDSATAYAERAVATCDTNVWYHLRLAQCLALTGRHERLCQQWERLTRLNPSRLEFYYELSNAYLSADNGTKAIEALNRVERMVGVTEEVSLQKQRIWNAMGRPEKGRRELEALTEALPGEKRFHAMLAESYMKSNQYAKAKEHYDKALAADPDDVYLHIALASYHKAVGDQQAAAEALRRGFESEDLDLTTKMRLLTSFYSKEEFYGTCSQYAFPLAESLMARAGDPAEMALFRADILMRQSRFAEAAESFALSLASDSSDFRVWESLLVCLLECAPTDWGRVRAAALRAADLFPLLPMPPYALAKCAEAEGDFPLARHWYERYLELRPDDSKTSEHLKEIQSWEKQR